MYWSESGARARVEAARQLATPRGERKGHLLGGEACKGKKGGKSHLLMGHVSMSKSEGQGCP